MKKWIELFFCKALKIEWELRHCFTLMLVCIELGAIVKVRIELGTVLVCNWTLGAVLVCIGLESCLLETRCRFGVCWKLGAVLV